MNRLVTCLVALSVLAVAAPSFAKHHEEPAKVEAKAEKTTKPAMKHKRKRMHKEGRYDFRNDGRHTYPGSSDIPANRHEAGMGLPAAVQQH